MACPAATVYRNYFCQAQAPDDTSHCGQAGGSSKQLDTSRDMASLVDNKKHGYWDMKNGYLLPKNAGGNVVSLFHVILE